MPRLNAYVAALAVLASQAITPAQTFETVHVLRNTGGASFGSLVRESGGSFLGTAVHDGMSGHGTVFRVSSQGEVTPLGQFNGINGSGPCGTLTSGQDGYYYGLTGGGGKGDRGTVFRINPMGNLETVADFSTIGAPRPFGRLTPDIKGNFYGICGDNSRSALFKLTPAKQLKILAWFDDSLGKQPQDGLVVQNDGSLIGVTSVGGSSDRGTVFRVEANGSVSKVADFTIANGGSPSGPLMRGSDGNLYGTATGGTDNSGIIYKVTPSGAISAVAFLDRLIGHSPKGKLIEDANGNVFGVGQGTPGNPRGFVFKFSISEANPIVTKVAELDETTGSFVEAGLEFGADGALYGLTIDEGAASNGTVFKVTAEGAITKFADLGGINGNILPDRLIPSEDGFLYGNTSRGAANDDGAFFRMNQDGELTKIVDYDSGTANSGPFWTMMRGRDGKFYGASSFGSFQNEGLYSMTSAGVIELVSTFPQPVLCTSLIEGSDGAFYGTGALFGGTIFRYSAEDGFQIMRAMLSSRLVEGPDGALYGTTETGGAFNRGTIFRIRKNSTFKTLASFNGKNGARPRGPVVFGRDGSLYGLASEGGANGTGTVYCLKRSGELTRLATFDGSNGAYPVGGLIFGPGGDLYGTAYAGGGAGKVGTLFKVSLSGKITVLQEFDGKTNGGYPASTLCFGADGSIYGTTYSTVFRLLTSNHAPVATNDSLELPVIQKSVISNDSDLDKDPLSIVSVTDGAHGTVEFTEDGTVTYLSGPDFDTESVQSDSFTYTISDGFGGTATATVTVSMPDNLFRVGAGAYGGVIALNGSAQGYWAMGVTGKGAFSGAIYVDGVKVRIRGAFLPNGTFTKIISRKAPLSPLTVNLRLDSIRNTITGSVVSGVDTYSVELIRNLPIYSSSRPNPNAGRYTVLLTPNQAGAMFPGGTGFATMTVTAKGVVAIVGKLGDGAPFTAGSFVTNDGEVPVYAQTYVKKKGYASGLLTFANLPDSDVSGTLSWKKPAQPKDALYPAGFFDAAAFVGARYENTSPVLLFPSASVNGSLILGDVMTNGLSVSSNNAVWITAPEGSPTKIKIDAKTGIFTGSYVDPNGGVRRTLGGAFYQKGIPRGEGLFFTQGGTAKATVVPSAN